MDTIYNIKKMSNVRYQQFIANSSYDYEQYNTIIKSVSCISFSSLVHSHEKILSKISLSLEEKMRISEDTKQLYKVVNLMERYYDSGYTEITLSAFNIVQNQLANICKSGTSCVHLLDKNFCKYHHNKEDFEAVASLSEKMRKYTLKKVMFRERRSIARNHRLRRMSENSLDIAWRICPFGTHCIFFHSKCEKIRANSLLNNKLQNDTKNK